MYNGNDHKMLPDDVGGSSSKSKTSSLGNYLSCSSTSSLFLSSTQSYQNRLSTVAADSISPVSGSTNINNNNSNNMNCGYSGIVRSLPELDNNDDSSMTDVVIDDLNDNQPTSTILNFCKRKFLRPYFGLLGLVGLQPNATDISCCWLCCSNIHTTFIFFIICFGYVLQYFSSFRRDRGFTPNEVHSISPSNNYLLSKNVMYNFGEIFFAYLIPSVIHLFGYLTAIYVFRVADNEQLQNLVERVFLMSTNPKRLSIRLWCYVIGSFSWLSMLLAYLILSVVHHPDVLRLPKYDKYYNDWQHIAKVFLVVTIFTHDFVQMVVLTSFCIECYLLRLHLFNLKEKLLHHTIESIDWMREVLEFRKLLNHLNHRVAIPVCFFTILNLTYAFAGIIYLFKEYDFDSPIKIFSLNIASIIIWLIIGLMPFFQAASVTRQCKIAQSSGHQIRVRPFVYDNATDDDLNSTLLFASSLNMSAKLFRMPIQGNYLCFTILIISIVILTLGMCLNVSLGIL